MKEPKQPPEGEQTPFDRFTEMTRRIVSVPKAQVDERAKRFTRESEKRRRGRN